MIYLKKKVLEFQDLDHQDSKHLYLQYHQYSKHLYLQYLLDNKDLYLQYLLDNKDLFLQYLLDNKDLFLQYLHKKTKEKVAIKKIPINYQDFRFEKEINNEINSLKTINCENSLKYYTHFKENGCYYIVTELCDSDLKTYVEKEHTNRFTSEEIREIFIQLNNAFRIMRQHNIMHRDLKLANILIKNLDNGKKIFKLGDFGKSRVLVSNRPGYYEKTRIGEYTIKAPELCKGSRYEKLFYDDKCDLWSIGVMMHHIYFQHLPPLYQRSDFIEDFDQYYYYLINNVRNSRHMHPQLRDLMFKLLVIDPEYRISWFHYFNHPFFTGS